MFFLEALMLVLGDHHSTREHHPSCCLGGDKHIGLAKKKHTKQMIR